MGLCELCVDVERVLIASVLVVSTHMHSCELGWYWRTDTYSSSRTHHETSRRFDKFFEC